MAKVQRTRSRSRTITGGSVWYAGSFQNAPSRESFSQTITDWIHKGHLEVGLTPVSDLSLYTVTREGGILNHTMKYSNDSTFRKKFSSCYTGLVGASPATPPGGWSALEGGDSAYWAAKLIAKTNPFRYEVSVPVMTLELIEGATLLGSLRNTVLANVGSAWLTKVYTIDAMKSDIRKLANITSAIESRIREFNSLVQKGGLRRKKVKLWKAATTGSEQTATIWSQASTTFSGRAKPSFKTKIWGSIRWLPKRDSPVDLTKLANANDAMRIILDLQTPDASTIWEAIPFSFVADYFSNIGDVLQALENTDLVIPTDICLMRERWVEYQTELIPSSFHNQVIVGGSGGGTTYTTQFDDGVLRHHYRLREVRTVTGIGDLLRFGICTPKQYTNLLALLSVLRSRKASFR